jgi:hypothetical protein
MIDTISFSCPHCEANINASGSQANKSVLCPSCCQKVKVPAFLQEPSEIDKDVPPAPVVFTVPKVVQEAKPSSQAQMLQIGGGAALVVGAVVVMWLVLGRDTAPVEKPAAKPQSEAVVKPAEVTPPQNPEAAALEALRKERERLQKELELKREKERLEQEINRLRYPEAAKAAEAAAAAAAQAAQAKAAAQASAQAAVEQAAAQVAATQEAAAAAAAAAPVQPALPTLDEVKGMIKKANAELVLAQRNVLNAQEESASLKSRIKMADDSVARLNKSIGELQEKMYKNSDTRYAGGQSYQQMIKDVQDKITTIQEDQAKRMVSLAEVEGKLPTLEQAAQDAGSKMKELKKLKASLEAATNVGAPATGTTTGVVTK